MKPNTTKDEYKKAIKKIKYHLEEGLTYQVNFTFKVKFEFLGDILALYLDLRRAQPTAYSALVRTEDETILSFSPELFFRINKNRVIARPMKGTIQRGLDLKQDRKFKQYLNKSKKIKAENLMIVDLLRNDLGRISKKVRVTNLFEIEKYRTLYQMTSTIEANLKDSLEQKDIFSAFFPCGSVTGAPKIKTMQIINKLEKEPRNIYTGAIGYISPDRRSCFNVAIRTLRLKEHKGEMGIGGGIVYDSKEGPEYKEALLKAKFFMKGFPEMSLIESILLTDKGYFLLDLHLKRLKNSCNYFSIPFDREKIKQEIAKAKAGPGERLKIRLLLDTSGNISLKAEKLEGLPHTLKVKLSSKKINSNNQFLYHKTTRRYFYSKERIEANKEGFFEVVFRNIKGELTEGTITNLFILKSNSLWTPPVECGLLPGTFREYYLKKGRAKEKILYPNDIKEADKIYIGNSLRGLCEAQIFLEKE